MLFNINTKELVILRCKYEYIKDTNWIYVTTYFSLYNDGTVRKGARTNYNGSHWKTLE